MQNMALGKHGVKAGSVENLWKSCGKAVEKCRVIRLALQGPYRDPTRALRRPCVEPTALARIAKPKRHEPE